MPPIPKITKWLMIVLTAIFVVDTILQMAHVVYLPSFLALGTLAHGFLPWQVATYGFLHGNELHLLFNLLGLWIFGSPLERLWGDKRYVQFLAASAVAGAALHLLMTTVMGNPSRMLGASGMVYGLLLAHGMLFPNKPISLIFPPVEMTTKTYVIIFGVLELWLGLRSQDMIAHFAHLGGMLGAFLMIQYWRGRPPFKGRRRF